MGTVLLEPAEAPSAPPIFVPLSSRFHCSFCRSPRVTFVAPGSDEVRSETGILICRAVPTRAACLVCRMLGRA